MNTVARESPATATCPYDADDRSKCQLRRKLPCESRLARRPSGCPENRCRPRRQMPSKHSLKRLSLWSSQTASHSPSLGFQHGLPSHTTFRAALDCLAQHFQPVAALDAHVIAVLPHDPSHKGSVAVSLKRHEQRGRLYEEESQGKHRATASPECGCPPFGEDDP
jgi:hypothetical protein